MCIKMFEFILGKNEGVFIQRFVMPQDLVPFQIGESYVVIENITIQIGQTLSFELTFQPLFHEDKLHFELVPVSF